MDEATVNSDSESTHPDLYVSITDEDTVTDLELTYPVLYVENEKDGWCKLFHGFRTVKELENVYDKIKDNKDCHFEKALFIPEQIGYFGYYQGFPITKHIELSTGVKIYALRLNISFVDEPKELVCYFSYYGYFTSRDEALARLRMCFVEYEFNATQTITGYRILELSKPLKFIPVELPSK